LVCPNCRRLLTGSASKSRNKQLHHYYHCQSKYGCNHRVRASLIHDKLEEYLGSFKIIPEVKRLYRVVLESKFGAYDSQRITDLQNLQKEKSRIHNNMDSLNEKFIENLVDQETYTSMKRKYDEQMQKIKSEEDQLNSQDTEFTQFISRGFTLIDNLKSFYQRASVEVKQKIVGSIFPQNLIFDKNEYRTSPINEAFRLITRVINQLQEAKKQNATQMDGILNLAPPLGLEPRTP
jgi:site-specific DNA recombinase